MPRKRLFSRSYEAILPSSLTWFLSRTLVCSTHPPVSVCGTGRPDPTLRRLFSAPADASSPRLAVRIQGRPSHHFQSVACTRSARRRFHSPAGRRNVRLLSIGYAFRPGLRPRLTPGGRTWPGKPRICGGRDSHPPFRYSCLHGRSDALQRSSRNAFAAHPTLSYQVIQMYASTTSAIRLSPDHFRRRVSRPVSCYAIFKWWLPLSQHPGCHGNLTSLQSTQRTIRGLSRRSGLFPFRPRSLSPAV